MASWAWLRAGGLSRRVALWTSAAALVGIASFAAALYVVLMIEASETEEAEEAGEGGEGLEEEFGEDILWAMLIAGPPSLLLAIGGTVWASRSAFAPLREVTRAAREITAADLGRRLEVSDGDRNLRELVVAFNELLARLEDNLEALDRYAADVSHELRTPLAVAITELEVSLRQPRSAEHWQAQAQRTLDDLRGLASLADAQLQLARSSAGAGLPRARMALLDELEPLIERTSKTAQSQGVAFEVRLPEPGIAPKVAGSAPLLRGALANVLDNALRHAGAGGRVSLVITEHVNRVRLVVEDSGPGIPEHERTRVFQPFVRALGADPDLARFGIGLAVARRSVLAHGGTIVAGVSSSLGGASLVLELPLAP